MTLLGHEEEKTTIDCLSINLDDMADEEERRVSRMAAVTSKGHFCSEPYDIGGSNKI